MIFVQYGNADACEEKATAIAKATPANNVFMVLFPISRLVVVAAAQRERDAYSASLLCVTQGNKVGVIADRVM